MDRKITSEDFHPMKEKTEKTLTGLPHKLKNLDNVQNLLKNK